MTSRRGENSGDEQTVWRDDGLSDEGGAGISPISHENVIQ